MKNFTYSDAGLALTKSFEGLRLKAYRDMVGVLTIGYGHTGADVHEGQEITEAEADELLRSDLAKCVNFVNSVIAEPVVISQGMFDAMVDFAFNLGIRALRDSTLLRKVNLMLFSEAKDQFALWVHAGGKVVEGLVKRRKAEAEMFIGHPLP